VKRRGFVVAAALLALLIPRARAADTVPRRVASMNLSADEILAEILPRDRLVGVTRFADERGTSNIVGRVPPSVFRFQKADMERLVALAPDLVVVSEYTDADFLKLVEQSGMRWHRMQGLSSIAGVRQRIHRTAARSQGFLTRCGMAATGVARQGIPARKKKGGDKPRPYLRIADRTCG